MMRKSVGEREKRLCTPCRMVSGERARGMTGIDPRHRRHHLSLLPSGPDEVHECLLRGDRSAGSGFRKMILEGGFSPA